MVYGIPEPGDSDWHVSLLILRVGNSAWSYCRRVTEPFASTTRGRGSHNLYRGTLPVMRSSTAMLTSCAAVLAARVRLRAAILLQDESNHAA